MMALRSRGDGFNLGDDFPPGLQQLHHLRFVMMEAWQGSFLFEVLKSWFKKSKTCHHLGQVTVSDILEIQFAFFLLRLIFSSSLLSQPLLPFEDHALSKRLNTSGSEYIRLNSLSPCLGSFLSRGKGN